MSETRTFNIPDSEMDRLRSEIAKLNRRADKLNCPPIAVEILESKMVPSPYYLKRLQKASMELGMPIGCEQIEELPKILRHTVRINGEGPKIEGYKFIGTLDHYTLPGEVIVQAVPGETVPPQFYHSEATCAHCNKIRRRIETFVVESEDGSYLQVGRNCLRDFFGHDPMSVARFLNRLFKFMDDLDDEDNWGARGMRSGDWMYLDKAEVLKTTVAVIRTFGWTPRSRSDENNPTADYVFQLMTPAFGAQEKEERRKLRESIKFNDEKDEAEATAALEWLATQDKNPDNSYMHNLGLIERAERCPIKMLGYWCSLVSTYQRNMEKLERAKSVLKLNEHFGTEGERIEIEVKCVGVRYTDGYYGPVTIHQMLTEAGHTLIWFANTDSKMSVGTRYLIRGRIKRHDEFNNWKQTHLSRVNVREELEAEKEAA